MMNLFKSFPKINNIGRILNLGKCFIITAIFILILQKGIYQHFGTIPSTSHRLISSTTSTLKHTVSQFEPKRCQNIIANMIDNFGTF